MHTKISSLEIKFDSQRFSSTRASIPLIILLVSFLLIFFWKLGEGGIRQWDESSLAVNALEMLLSGNPIVKYMGGEIDLINTKPPLTIWFIAGSMKVFGYTEFALRLPSAICSVATVFIIYTFCKQYLKEGTAAFLSALVLITSIGFTGEHVARTGDYDAMLVLWITIYSLSCFMYLESRDDKEKSFLLFLTTLALVLAVWTKGIAGLLVLPSLAIYTVYKRKILQILLSPQIYLAAISFIILALSYYFIRELYSPGFLQAVIQNELTGRYADLVPGGTRRGFSYYLNGMISYRFVPWIYLLPVCWVVVYIKRKKTIRDFDVFGLIYFTTYFFIISYSQTKFHWYDAPLYPMSALIIGLGLATIFRPLIAFPRKRINGRENSLKKSISYFIILSSLFLLPYLNNLYEVYRGIPFRENDKSVTEVALLYRDYLRELESFNFPVNIRELKVVNHHRYNLPLLFYVQASELNQKYALNLEWNEPDSQVFQGGDVVINCGLATIEQYQVRYLTQTLHQSGSCKTLSIKG